MSTIEKEKIAAAIADLFGQMNEHAPYWLVCSRLQKMCIWLRENHPKIAILRIPAQVWTHMPPSWQPAGPQSNGLTYHSGPISREVDPQIMGQVRMLERELELLIREVLTSPKAA